jgi:hypothetical protein
VGDKVKGSQALSNYVDVENNYQSNTNSLKTSPFKDRYSNVSNSKYGETSIDRKSLV